MNLQTEAEGFPDDASECKIFDTAGDLVITLEFNNNKQFTWDGNNDAGRKCSSGIYFYVISGNDDYARGKFALIR
ncbi:MAG: gliding motility-associated C-terminal domain-containing protein [Candidatus Zophobacter franzmannii]|nr:gliding motility-associated C-terminal domain-containing protein [Candidatus Zophobacter franzmannii]